VNRIATEIYARLMDNVQNRLIIWSPYRNGGGWCAELTLNHRNRFARIRSHIGENPDHALFSLENILLKDRDEIDRSLNKPSA
jgi:hypothetical protein